MDLNELRENKHGKKILIMKREIKFRGKRIDNSAWVYGDLIHLGNGCIIYHGSQENYEITSRTDVAIELLDDEISVVRPETVGQFTEIPTSDGGDAEEIYEHDIVGFIELDEHVIAEVIFENGCFCFRDKDGQIYYPQNVDCISLLGNKFDNHGLLEGGSDEE